MSGKNLLRTWHKFLQGNFNFFKRGSINVHKERKYEHIEIQKDFEEIERKRKHERLTLIEYKKKLRQQLLQQQLQLAQKEAQGLLTDADKEIAKDAKKAEQVSKAAAFKTFKDFSKNLKDSERQITESLKNKDINALSEELKQLSQELDSIKNLKKELESVEQKIEDLEPGYVLLSGIDKKLVLNQITYYEFQYRILQGVVINPETLKAIETVHYHVEHNLPVRRELLYEVVPEFFETEIGELDQYERDRILKKRPRLGHMDDAIVRAVDSPPEERNISDDFFENLKKQEMEFMNFVYSKAGEYTLKYHDHFEQKLSEGFPTMEAVLENLDNKKAEERSEIEKTMYDGLQELKRINQDYADLIKLNKAKVHAKQREVYIPEFIKGNEKLQKAWVDKWEQLVTGSFDFSQSILLPQNSDNFESKLDKVLKDQRAQDINELIAQSQEEYKKRVSIDGPPEKINRDTKDPKVMQKLEVLSGALNQVEGMKKHRLKQRVKAIYFLNSKQLDHFQDHIGYSEMPEEGRILIEEYTKVLLLNNRDPAKYNLTFWSEHFNIEPQKLRNIFNFVSYGIPDKNNQKDIGRVLRFVYEADFIPENRQEKLKQM